MIPRQEFFSENLWDTLPVKWQQVISDLTPPQIADLLLDRWNVNRSYSCVWPLSLLSFRATAHALAFPRKPQRKRGHDVDTVKSEEFLENQSQSSLLGHIFRKHVKPKKQHEIQRLGTLVRRLCDLTDCNSVVDVGSGQGHLTRFLSFGLGLSVTGIEADPTLVSMASKFDGQLLWTLEKERQKFQNGSQLSTSGPSPCHVAGWVNPKASWEDFVKQVGSGTFCCDGQMPGVSKKRQREPVTVVDQLQQHTGQTESTADIGRSASLPLKDNIKTTGFNGDNPTSPPEIAVSLAAQPGALSLPKRLCKNEAGQDPYAYPVCRGSLSTGGVVCPADNGQACPDFVLTGLHACGDLSATLLRHFSSCPHVRGITSVACCYMKITTSENPNPPGLIAPPINPLATNETFHSEYGYPMSSWVQGLPGHQLSYKAREGACHAIEEYMQRLREESASLRTHCYRAALETVIREAQPELRRVGVQTIKKAHLLSFTEYARLGLPRVGLPPDLPLDADRVEAMLRQEGRVVVYFSLALLLAPVVETLVLLDRMLYLQEKGLDSQLVPLFDPAFSPRNLVLMAMKPTRDKETERTLS
ncbi:protein RRNAD1 isoform X2 [Esox lucius]|uniref:protein RRNAD1 isoform X2 n=1 Tax=Esox lucius TaxID=8010 RepID=UPI001477009C|nr:protein RRNAD1 isoform X2 [Esox lucius]XP_019896882.2 protein RRNAD1 isoform X2 [Esox lucius]XP_019896883.2 protein RRNAD1 isoform X2 [Esox lucius]